MRTPLTFSWTAKYLIHIAALFVGFVLAYELRRALPIHWWFVDPDAVRVLGWAGLFALIGAGVEAVFQAERAAWRFASARDVVALARNVSLTMALFLVSIFFVDRGLELPRSVLPLAWLLSLMFLVGARVAWRLPQESGLSEQIGRAHV